MASIEAGRGPEPRPEEATVTLGREQFSGRTVVAMADFYRERSTRPELGTEPHEIEADSKLADMYAGALREAGVVYPRPETEVDAAGQEQIAA